MTKKIDIDGIDVLCLDFDVLKMNTMYLTFINNVTINTSATTETFTGHAAVVWRGLFMTALENQLIDTLDGLNELTHPPTHTATMIVESVDGSRVFFTPEEEEKLSQIAAGANNYTHPTWNDDGDWYNHTLSEIRDSATRVRMTIEERLKLATIAVEANNYAHPVTHQIEVIDGLVDSNGYLIPQPKPIIRLDSTNRLINEPVIDLTANNVDNNFFEMAVADLPSDITNTGFEWPYIIFDKSVSIGDTYVNGVCLMFGLPSYYTLHWFNPLTRNLILGLISSDGVSSGMQLTDLTVLRPNPSTDQSKLSFHLSLNIENFLGKLLYFSTNASDEYTSMSLYKRRGFKDYIFSGTFKQTDVVNRFTTTTLNSFLISRDPNDTVPYINPIWISNLNAYQTQHWDYTVFEKVKAFNTLDVPNKALLFNYGVRQDEPLSHGVTWRYSQANATVFSPPTQYPHNWSVSSGTISVGNAVVETFMTNYGTKIVFAYSVYSSLSNQTTIYIIDIDWAAATPSDTVTPQQIIITGRISDITLNCINDNSSISYGTPPNDTMLLVFQRHNVPNNTIHCYKRHHSESMFVSYVTNTSIPTFIIHKLVATSTSTKVNGIPSSIFDQDSLIFYGSIVNLGKYGIIPFTIAASTNTADVSEPSITIQFEIDNYLNADFGNTPVIPLQRSKLPDFLTHGHNWYLLDGLLKTEPTHCIVGYADAASIDIPNHVLVIGYKRTITDQRHVFIYQQIPNYKRTGGDVQLSNMLFACVGDGQNSELWFVGSERFIQRFQIDFIEWRLNHDNKFGVWDYRIQTYWERGDTIVNFNINNPLGKLPRFLFCMENRGLGTASCLIFNGKVYTFTGNSIGTSVQDWLQAFGLNQPLDLDGAHTSTTLRYEPPVINETWNTWDGRTFTYFGWFGDEYVVDTNTGPLTVTGVPGRTMFAVVNPGQTILTTHTPNMILFRYHLVVDALHLSDSKSWATAIRLGDDDIVTNRPIYVVDHGITFTGTNQLIVAIFFAEFAADTPGIDIVGTTVNPFRSVIHQGFNQHGDLDEVIIKPTSTLIPHPINLAESDEKYLYVRSGGEFEYSDTPDNLTIIPGGKISTLPIAKVSFSDNKVTEYTKYPTGDYFETEWLSYTLPETITIDNPFMSSMVMVQLYIRNTLLGFSDRLINTITRKDGVICSGLKISFDDRSITASPFNSQTQLYSDGYNEFDSGEIKLTIKRLF